MLAQKQVVLVVSATKTFGYPRGITWAPLDTHGYLGARGTTGLDFKGSDCNHKILGVLETKNLKTRPLEPPDKNWYPGSNCK